MLEDNIDRGWDIIIIARVTCNNSNYKDISETLINLLKRNNIYN